LSEQQGVLSTTVNGDAEIGLLGRCKQKLPDVKKCRHTGG
jgi:hypothetical protein